MALALTGDTWGISGPTFLTAYLLLAAAVWLAGTMTRRRLTDPRPDRPIGELDARPHDVAHLHGGPDLAVTSALSSMHLTGTVAPVAGQIQAVGRLGPGADSLERAVHFATGSPVRRQRLPFHGTVRTALDGIEQRLVAAGLLLSPDDRRRIRGVGWWLVGVAALGLVRLLAGLSEARPIGFLTAATIAVAVVAGVQLSWAPRRTRSGDRALAQLRSRHHDLDPESRPDRVAYGPAAVALGVGLFGASALWASDPAFASEIELQRATAGGADSGFVGGGGDSGGGGGDGGGGGGCGGGGGGCGG